MFNLNEIEQSEFKKNINISGFLFCFFRKWRVILIFVILIAVLFGGIFYLKSKSTNNATISEERKIQIDEIVKEKIELEKNKEYKSNSLLMNMNYMNVNKTNLIYYVAPSVDNGKSYSETDFLKSFTSYADGEGIIDDIYGNLNIDSDKEYIDELISSSYNYNDSEVKTFVISILAPNKEIANELSEAVQNAIEEYSDKIEIIIGTNDLKLVSDVNSTVVDTTLKSTQDAVKASVLADENSITSLVNIFNENELSYYNDCLTLNGIKTISLSGVSLNVSKTYVLKNMILGAVLGLLLAVLYISIKYILNSKLNSVKEIKDNFNLKLLGVLSIRKNKKRLFGFIDDFINKVYLNYNAIEYEKELELLITNIVLKCKRKKLSNIFITGNCIEEKNWILQEISEKLDKKNIGIEFGFDSAYNPESLEKMAEAESVIIVSIIGKTSYKDINNYYNICLENELDLIGMIVIV